MAVRSPYIIASHHCVGSVICDAVAFGHSHLPHKQTTPNALPYREGPDPRLYSMRELFRSVRAQDNASKGVKNRRQGRAGALGDYSNWAEEEGR